MIKNLSGILHQKFLVLFLLVISFGILTYLSFPWEESVDDAFIHIQYKLRGKRTLDSNFVVIYMGDKDLKNLGGWPITRDYYSYLIHILNSAGARVIAIDILFARPDRGHPEYDATFAHFLNKADNVVLPMVFSELLSQEKPNDDNNVNFGESPTFPLQAFRENALVGFSNFSKSNNMLKIPLIASYENQDFLSFGAQMARLFLKEEKQANLQEETLLSIFPENDNSIHVNHFGDGDQLELISFVDLLNIYRTKPDSLNFNNKLVLLTVTAPGVSSLKSTPLSNALPASFIHLTVAENLIKGNYFTVVSPHIQMIIICLGLILMVVFLQFRTDKTFIFFCCGLLLVFWLASFLAFSIGNLIIAVFYPSLAYIIAFTWYFAFRLTQKGKLQSSMHDLLQKQIAAKEIQLKTAREALNSQTTTTDELKHLAEQRKKEILGLEKQINDLKIYSGTAQNTSEIRSGFKEIVYTKNSPLEHVLDLVLKVSPNNIPVLITGETGTGKEMIARAIHMNSLRKNHPFVAVNCGALSETLLESELFGHEKGSFTGAVTMRRGRFELANGGSIFLDEISETSFAFQARLLRVIQESTFERVGAERSIHTDIRIIAATNKNLQDEMEKENFRADLFYRLNGFPIQLPPLRERKDDLPLLVQHFLKKYKFQLNVSDQVIRILSEYHWPGNVRELENHIHRAAILAQSENRKLIRENDFSADLLNPDRGKENKTIHKPIEEQILEMMRTLKFSHSSISQTAKELGNRDRGTVTEYFRGLCFEYLVNANFDIDRAAADIADSENEQITDLVKNKINTYLENLNPHDPEASSYKGLPKKYHVFLEKVLKHLEK